MSGRTSFGASMPSILPGRSPRLIAAGFNRDRVTPPRGRLWNATTINGYGKRGSGILHNELYAGLIVWNKNRKLLNPYTGKRVGRPNDAADRQVVEVPQLRIVDQDTWQAVQALKAQGGHSAGTGSPAGASPLRAPALRPLRLRHVGQRPRP